MPRDADKQGTLAVGGLAAVLASACCLGPLVLVSIGLSGAWIGQLTRLEPLLPWFLPRLCVSPHLASGVSLSIRRHLRVAGNASRVQGSVLDHRRAGGGRIRVSVCRTPVLLRGSS